jgi:predicted NAD/FAD-binding protein
MKIVAQGSGISGLRAAYDLSKKHKIDLFEKEDHFGGHAFTLKIPYEDEKVAINRAIMTKFGIKVVEFTVMFVKD